MSILHLRYIQCKSLLQKLTKFIITYKNLSGIYNLPICQVTHCKQLNSNQKSLRLNPGFDPAWFPIVPLSAGLGPGPFSRSGRRTDTRLSGWSRIFVLLIFNSFRKRFEDYSHNTRDVRKTSEYCDYLLNACC